MQTCKLTEVGAYGKNTTKAHTQLGKKNANSKTVSLTANFFRKKRKNKIVIFRFSNARTQHTIQKATGYLLSSK